MDEVDVPSYFLCPISLDIMKDPVTIPTGITYDRESIERWLFSSSKTKTPTCPVTKQPVQPDCDLTPNHTLRRLIQSWCVINASRGVERIPTPKPPISKALVGKLIKDATYAPPATRLECLRRLKSIASHGDANKRCLEAAGAIEFLASMIHVESCNGGVVSVSPLVDEALSILCSLHITESRLRNIADVEFVESLTSVMRSGVYDSRAYAVILLSKMLIVAEPVRIAGLSTRLFLEVVQVLHERISHRATKAALQLLVHLSPLSRNRFKAVEAGAVPVLIELLLEHNSSTDHVRICEMALTALDILCQCAEGRANLLRHGAGIAVVSKKILRVSQAASERAVRILLSISRFSGTPRVQEEMLQVGVVTKLCLILQVDCGSKTKDKAVEILRMNSRTWKNSPCIPHKLLSSYPN